MAVDPTSGMIMTISIGSRSFEVVNLLYSLNSLVGCATKVWLMKNNGQLYTLKDYWVQMSHMQSEAVFLQAMSTHPKIKGLVPELLCSEDVLIHGVRDCTENYRKDLHGWPFSQHIHCCIASGPMGDPLVHFHSKQEFILVISSLILGKPPNMFL
jgi:hypothetical protein